MKKRIVQYNLLFGVKDREGRPISLEVIGIFPSELNIAERLKTTIGRPKDPVLLLC